MTSNLGVNASFLKLNENKHSRLDYHFINANVILILLGRDAIIYNLPVWDYVHFWTIVIKWY